MRRFGTTELVENYSPSPRRIEPDGFLTIVHASGAANRYVCEAKHQINSATLNTVLVRLKDMAAEWDASPLLLTDYVAPALANTISSGGVAHIDRVGNIRLVDLPLFVWLQAFKPVEPPTRTARALHTTGLRLIALLLARPAAINWPYRQLAAQAGLSLGSTSRILSDLRGLGFIHRVGPNQDALVQRHSLFEHWEFGYLSRLRPSLKPQTFRQVGEDRLEQLPELIPPTLRKDILIGGELAAAIATGYLRPQSVVLYVPPHRPLLPLMKALRLVPDRHHGNVTLIEQMADIAAWRWPEFEQDHLVHPLLVHAELLQGQVDDRLRETARRIFDQWLLPTMDDDAKPA